MMKKKIAMMGILFITVFSLALFAGCAKMKSTVAEGTDSSAAQEAVTLSAAAAQEALRDINFDYDKSNIGPDARVIMKANADILLKNTNFNLIVEGHCDERGTSEYNMALGERRAQEAKKYLINLGVDGARMKTISYGEERPLDSRSNEDAWAKNRRAHFLIVQ